MSDVAEGISPELDKVVADAVDEAQQAEPTPAEAKATKAGWRPKEEWDDSGSAEWMDAEQFNERNERLANRGDKILKAEISSLTRKVSSMERTLGEAAEHLKKADARAYQKALKEIEVKAEKAVEEGDTDAYRRAKGEIKELEQEVKAEAKVTPPPTQKDDPEFDSWLSHNSWYDPATEDFDPEISDFAGRVSKEIARLNLPNPAFLVRVTAEVKKKFPDRFGNQRRRQAPAVEGAGGGSGGNGKTLWSQVPKSVQQGEFKKFVAEKLYEDTPKGREKYADIYLNG